MSNPYDPETPTYPFVPPFDPPEDDPPFPPTLPLPPEPEPPWWPDDHLGASQPEEPVVNESPPSPRI